MGALLFLFFFIVSISGFLLGWKKNSFGLILPKSAIGTSTDLSKWKPIEQLHQIADSILVYSIDARLSKDLDRIDIRKDKGIVKFIYVNHYNEIQLDGATGKLLQINQRRSDFIEDIHDGSYLDFYFKTKGEPIKLVYTLIMGLSLFTFTFTGFWLWYGPKIIRKKRRSE